VKRLFVVIVAAGFSLPLLSSAGEAVAVPDRLLVAQAKQGQPERGRFQRDAREAQRGERSGRDERRRSRFTEEERRELHRDLDRARRDIYRPSEQRPESR
jgi:hypothetical protein